MALNIELPSPLRVLAKETFNIYDLASWNSKTDFLLIDVDAIKQAAFEWCMDRSEIWMDVLQHEWFHRRWHGMIAFLDVFSLNAMNCRIIKNFNEMTKTYEAGQIKSQMLSNAIIAKRIFNNIKPILEADVLYWAQRDEDFKGNIETISREVYNPSTTGLFKQMKDLDAFDKNSLLHDFLIILALDYPKMAITNKNLFIREIPPCLNPKARFLKLTRSLRDMQQRERKKLVDLSNSEEQRSIFIKKILAISKLKSSMLAISKLKRTGDFEREPMKGQKIFDIIIKKESYNWGKIIASSIFGFVEEGKVRIGDIGDYGNMIVEFGDIKKIELRRLFDTGRLRKNEEFGVQLTGYEKEKMLDFLNLTSLSYQIIGGKTPMCIFCHPNIKKTDGTHLTLNGTCLYDAYVRKARKITDIFNSVEIPELELAWKEINNKEM